MDLAILVLNRVWVLYSSLELGMLPKEATFLSLLIRLVIDQMQKWLPLNYSFVCIQNSLNEALFTSR